jgi:tetratricopeptide (TPR) repeat protein
MLKRIPFILLLLLVQAIAVAGNESRYKVPQLRTEYLEASKDKEAAERFNKKMSQYGAKDPVVLAYKAASEAVMAKYVWNPYSKLKQIKTAAAIFEEAVELDKDHPEIRFLRFTVEHYVPRYLNLSPNLESDKQVMIRSLKSHPNSGISAEFARTMRDFLLSKDHCTEAEKQELRKISI